MTGTVFRKGRRDDVERVFALIEKRIRWMDEKGIRHWNTQGYTKVYPLSHYAEQQRQGNLFVLEDAAGDLAGAVVLYRQDPRWGGDPEPPAYYIHHLVTDPAVSGAGTVLLRQIEQTAAENGIGLIRLDCSAANEFLNRYYREQGFVPVGDCTDGPYRGIRYEKRL